MGGLFSKSKKGPSRVTDQDKAVLQLKRQRDELKVYQKRINGQMEKDRQIARELLKMDKKDKALLLLRKKKYQETLITRTDQQLENINQLVGDIEFAQIEVQVVNGLDAGNKALKTLHQFMSLERVEQVMDETQEAVEYQREIDSLISGGLTGQEEADVEAELDELLKESLANLPDVAGEELGEATPQLPDVPRTKVKSNEGRVAMEAS